MNLSHRLFNVILAALLIFNLLPAGIANTTDRVGWWNFNNTTDLLAPVPGYGGALQLTGTHQLVPGPSANDYAVKIGPGSYYTMSHNIQPNGGGNLVNEFTLQIDFKVETTSVWHCFFQTNPANTNDGDCFINPNGKIGVAATGYAATSIQPETWYRLVISVDNGSFYNYYIDGYNLFTGYVQNIDDRFSLNDVLLMFADEDGEDNNIIVSEIAIWDRPLSAIEINSIGGFGHILNVSPYFVAYPFLQTVTSNSAYVCWHDTLTSSTTVEYGTGESLGSTATGTSELLAPMYRWHTVKLTGLEPDTRYYYRIDSGSDTSAVYNFRTQPADPYNGHIRFLLFSDTQDDSAMTGKVVRSARDKVAELYGGEISDNINLMAHTGDIVGSGSVISYWTDQFMRPFSPLTPYIPYLSVAGNHEGEHPNYYKYMKYDDISAYPPSHALFEKIWTYRLPRILLVGLNSNVIATYGETQRLWLDAKLAEAEADTAIDFVFCFLHHPPFTELWGEGNTAYVADDILGVLKKYSKVQQLSYGHTHAYEMGVVQSEAENTNGDFRISCVGGGGGNRDRWGEYINNDYPEINIALDHHFYILFDFDLAEKSYTGYMYDLGNSDYPVNNVVSDSWSRKLNQPAPEKPQALNPSIIPGGNLILHASEYAGTGELMSSQFQVTATPGDYANPIINTIRDWRDIYGVDNQFNPVDLNAGIDLASLEIPADTLQPDSTFAYRVRYRDQNLKWSNWSDELTFYYTDTTGIDETGTSDQEILRAWPNPVQHAATISYVVAEGGNVDLAIYNLAGCRVMEIESGKYDKGCYTSHPDVSNLSAGMYFCRFKSQSGEVVIKLIIGN
ncbi:MAG TPA: fibronectin type III domain-containing protein [Bacteroidales bacterium]|nr:fibronectin type III domain-containing protein [Bacteroidales bacterium]